MPICSRLAVASLLLLSPAVAFGDEAYESSTTTGTEQIEREADLRPPSAVGSTPYVAPAPSRRSFATTERWGGGVRLTGLSGIGALPGVNYGGELAALIRRDEMFVELAVGKWKPEKTYVITETPNRVELDLDVWTLRGGWASMQMPLRAWALAEAGELASPRMMTGVVTRMMTGETPQARRWQALGGGLGVAWPMSDSARLIGMMEIAVPIARSEINIDQYGAYQPDPLAARASCGLELGWR